MCQSSIAPVALVRPAKSQTPKPDEYFDCMGLAGVTGLEAEPFCDFAEDFDGFSGDVHTGAHKKKSRIGTSWRRLARMLGSETRSSRQLGG
jgi:hypothetical protein